MPLSVNRLGLCRTHVTAAATAMLCFSCNYGEVVVVTPAAAGHGPLTISIQADPEDSTAARELGWSRGIPGAEVTVSPADADTAAAPPVAVLRTDSAGAARVPDLPDGHYLVEVRRLLASAEAAQLAPTEDVIGFMANTVVERGSDTVLTPASHRRSIVISEWAFNTGSGPGISMYYFGGYLELANNSDTTVYLDGLVIGEAYSVAWEYKPGGCAGSEGATNDPDGVWTQHFDSLPGTGHTYPLAPGATAVIATDAVDHTAIIPGGLDLSHANFEFPGTADADNPSVPNAVDIGLVPYRFDHGLFLNNLLEEVTFVALPVDVAALPMTPGREYVRVPRERILDVIALLSVFDFNAPLCPHLVHRNFDRYRSRLMGMPNSIGFLHSIERKVAYTRADGRKILQHTRTSNADFYFGPRTPGWLP